MKKEALNITRNPLCIYGKKYNNYYWEDNGVQDMVVKKERFLQYQAGFCNT